ncbi:MAG: cellulose synthase family protein [Bacteroidota bacterium]
MSVLTSIFLYVVLGVYLIALTLIVIYGVGQFHLVYTYWRLDKKHKPLPPLDGQEGVPKVTIQLPIYNEKYVVDRLLEAVAAMDYPKDSFEIQVLDDSTDETVGMIAAKVEEIAGRGIAIHHIRRPDRVGFKAGALEYGLASATGEFIAIFDADFVPQPSFIRAILPYFAHEEVGVVQARWQHINQDYSLFTEVQAFHLDAHFTVEQRSRDLGGFYMNFNGTAGIWRKACIQDAGGWEHDTLTEDLDLSYRAQLKGWKFRYVDNVEAPAELPAEMGGIKSQQYRWMKGGAEVARKILRTLWQSDISLGRKLHGSMHLLSSSVFILVLLLGATSVPLVYIKHELLNGKVDFLLVPVGFLLLSFVVLCCLYILTFIHREGSVYKGIKRFALNFVPFLAFSMGLSLHNSIAVLQGFWGKRTPFIRTPKYALSQKQDSWRKRTYLSKSIKPTVFLELLMALYFCFGVYLAIHFQDISIIPFLLMQAGGYTMIGINSFRHAV